MISAFLVSSRPIRWSRLTCLLLLLVLLASLGYRTSSPYLAPNIQSTLVALAMERPNAMVRVIVQKLTQHSSPEQEAVNLGGHVTRQLPIINAFVAELPAQAVLKLARDANVRWISLDAATAKSACAQCIDVSNLSNAYISTIGADKVWNEAPYLQGQGIGVAVIDSGISQDRDLGQKRLLVSLGFTSSDKTPDDRYGHGTHVAGIIGGSGQNSGGHYIGVAPKANLISLKVSDKDGGAWTSDIIAAMEWIYTNQAKYNIRVVNLSFNSSIPESYHNNPISVAAEILWFNSIVVVVSAGNNERGLYPPANDPFVITVGATRDQGTPNLSDDTLAPYSGYGTTSDGFAKPELLAPGSNIVSISAGHESALVKGHPDHRVDKNYFRMSGTSMSAPMVTGAVALLLQDEPNLTPDQVKYRLMATARPFTANGSEQAYLDIYAAIHGSTTQSANTGIEISRMLSTEDSKAWDSKSWNSKSWNSKSWNSKSWNSKSWDSKSWSSDYWDE